MRLWRKLTKYRPLFKKIIKTRCNVANNKKLLKQKKKKWSFFLSRYSKRLKYFKKYKAYSQRFYKVVKFARKSNSYKKRYRNTLNVVKTFKIFYGNFLKKQIKKKIRSAIKQHRRKKTSLMLLFLKKMETRLDITLVRSKLCISVRMARQLITHGNVNVNRKKIIDKNYELKPGDLVEISPFVKHRLHKLYRRIARFLDYWPHPPKHLHINYRTLQIICGTVEHANFSNFFNLNLKIEKMLLNYIRM